MEKGIDIKKDKWIPACAGMTMLAVTLLAMILLAGAAVAQEEVLFPIRDFSGGMVTDYDNSDMERKYGFWMLNMDCVNGRLEWRPGFTLYKDTPESTITSSYKCQSMYAYGLSEPNIDGRDADSSLFSITGSSELILTNEANAGATIALRKFYTYPFYLGRRETIATGGWTDSFSKDYNEPTYAVGRTIRLYCSELSDYLNYAGSVRIAAGNVKQYVPSTDVYTYPWWFGYIGRYFWYKYERPCDDFYLYSASCFEPHAYAGAGDGGLSMSCSVVGKSTTTPKGTPIDITDSQGRIWIRAAYEYDGFQNSIAFKQDSVWWVDVPNDSSMIQCIISLDSTISKRITALTIFTTDIEADSFSIYRVSPTGIGNLFGNPPQNLPTELTAYTGKYVNPETVPFYFRKRIGISDPDTSNLGWMWKESNINKRKYRWWDSAGLWKDTLYIDGDDFNGMMPEMYSYLDHTSSEIIVLPSCMGIVGDRGLAGNVLIDSPTSKVHKTYANMVVLSPWGQPDVFPINNHIRCGANQGSYVTAIKEWNGKALIWTNDAFEIWDVADFPFRLEQFVQMGCTVPRSVQITPQGVFWANNQAVYHYSGTGIPQPISTMIQTELDSFVVGTTSGKYYSAQKTFPYSSSVYLPDAQTYILLMDSVYSSTIYASATYSLFSEPLYGGDKGLAYNIPFQAWGKYDYDKFIRGVVYSSKNNIYFLAGAPTGSPPTTAQWDIYRYTAAIDTNYESMNSLEFIWDSGWTDLGYPNQYKELRGVELDYEAGYLDYGDSNIDPDTLTVRVYADGKDEAYDVMEFWARTSNVADADYRRSHYTHSDSIGSTIEDMQYALPTLFRFQICFEDSFESRYPFKINAITPHFIPRGIKQ